MDEISYFSADYYRRHNQRRQEHLATLNLPLANQSVLEVGAGIGDHTSFFLDRNCAVTSTEGRASLVEIIKRRYPNIESIQWNLEEAPAATLLPHDIVYCYGILYHVNDPGFVLANLSLLTKKIFLLETCVSFGEQLAINTVDEPAEDPTQAISGKGCRPTRPWIFEKLKEHYPFVYVTKTQPWHEEFPLDWRLNENPRALLSRSVFVASKVPVLADTLSAELLELQTRC